MDRLKKIIGEIIGFVLLLFERTVLSQFDKHVLSVYFHNPSSFLFNALIQYLVAKDFEFIDENEFYDIITGKRTQDGRKAFVSFDDGWQGNLKLIPAIEKYNVPISLFVPVQPVVLGNFWWEYVGFIKKMEPGISGEKDLKSLPNKQLIKLVNKASKSIQLQRSAITLDELRYLHHHPLVTIGSHTCHHPISLNCTTEELRFEYVSSKETLELWLKTSINSFSYPNGDYNKRDIDLLKEYGYKMAFTTDPKPSGPNQNVYEIPRVSINSKGGRYENIARMLGLWHKYVPHL